MTHMQYAEISLFVQAIRATVEDPELVDAFNTVIDHIDALAEANPDEKISWPGPLPGEQSDPNENRE